MATRATLEEALEVVERLSALDKVRLIGRILPEIEQALIAAQSASQASLPGLANDADNTAEAKRETEGGQ